MKAAVVYYSMSGNIAMIANKLCERLCADPVELQPQKAYPDKGMKKFLWGGKSVLMAETPALKPYSFDPAAYDLILVASPVWASSFAPPIRTFLTEQKKALSTGRVACVFSSLGGNAKKALEKLQKLLDLSESVPCLSLIEPKNKPEDEIDKALDAFLASLKA